MGHTTKGLVKQVQEKYDSMLQIGESKYQAKKDHTYKQYIYSWDTYKAYMKHASTFVKWCKEEHQATTLAQCKKYINEYLKLQTEKGLSAWTIKLQRAALVKLYGLTGEDIIKTPTRRRENISRSRQAVKSDIHFSEKENANLVAFCRSTGLRRHELQNLTGNDYIIKDKRLYIHVKKGKGGKERYSLVLGDKEYLMQVYKMMLESGSGHLFSNIPAHADIHSYRAQYAQALYDLCARDTDTIPYDTTTASGSRRKSEVYHCRGDKKGTSYDRRALQYVSQQLGHQRQDVVAYNYLYK